MSATEEIDVARLRAWLIDQVPGLDGALEVDRFTSGYSNLTYLVRFGGRELVLRRPPRGADIKSAHDMGREYRMLTRLLPVYPLVPRAVAECATADVIGAPFYVMERVDGVIPRSGDDLRRLGLSPAEVGALCGALVGGLADLHAVDWQAAGLADLGRPAGYVERQVRGWSERYVRARTDDVPSVERVAAWLEANRPAESGASIIHNDYKYDNVVLDRADPTRIVAVLDWEMATLGDPLMDLGSSLGYWVDADDPAFWQKVVPGAVTAVDGNFSREAVVDEYARRTGRPVERPVFYYAYGLFKLAVIAQQIYARFRKGLTRDGRFGRLDAVVAACGEMGCRAIDRGRIGRLG